jgi:hypothetical protein
MLKSIRSPNEPARVQAAMAAMLAGWTHLADWFRRQAPVRRFCILLARLTFPIQAAYSPVGTRQARVVRTQRLVLKRRVNRPTKPNDTG